MRNRAEQRASRRGIALITTLMTISLLLTLIGAFLGASQSGSALTSNSNRRKMAEDACSAGLQYAWARLEKDCHFGEINPALGITGHYDIPNTGLEPAGAPVMRLVSRDAQVFGDLHPSGAFDAGEASHFQLTVKNNLESGNSWTVSNQVQPIYKFSALVEVTGWCGGVSRKTETILRRTPASHESALAGGKLRIDTSGRLRVESRDPAVNRMRAGLDAVMPNADNLRFLGHGDLVTQEDHRLLLGGLDVARAPEAQRTQISDQTSGSYKLSRQPPEMAPFNPDDYRLPTRVTPVPRGTWLFGGLDYTDYRQQSIAWSHTTVGPMGVPVTTSGACTRYQRREATYDRLTAPAQDGRVWVARNARANTTRYYPPLPTGTFSSEAAANSWGFPQTAPSWEGGVIPTGQGNVITVAAGFKANVLTAQIAVSPGYRLQTDGPFLVEAGGVRKPEILFGYNFSSGGVPIEVSMDDGEDAAQQNPEDHMAALEASGDISVPGGALGFGSMVAGGDMTVKASSGLHTAPKLGVILKARDLTLLAATESEPQQPGEPLNIDQPVFKDGLNNFVQDGNWSRFDNWAQKAAPVRRSTVQQLKSTALPLSAQDYWALLNTALATNESLPAEVSSWPSPLTLDHYVRLKEFAQTLASGYNRGEGDLSWLDLQQHGDDAEQRLENSVSELTQWAKSYSMSLHSYVDNPPQNPEMFYQGLLFADRNLKVECSGKSFRNEGSMVSGRDLEVIGASSVDLVYDRSLTDGLIKKKIAPAGGGYPLEQLFNRMFNGS